MEGSNDTLRWAAPTISAWPLSMSLYFNADTWQSDGDRIGGLCHSTTLTNEIMFAFFTSPTPDEFRLEVKFDVNCASSLVPSTGSWYHATGAIASNTDRAVWLDGANKGTATNSVTIPASMNRAVIGGIDYVAIIRDWNGKAAEFGIWDSALGDDEADALGAHGLSPLMVDPANLQLYADCLRGTPWVDRRSGLAATVNGTVNVVEHPPVVYPRGARSIFVPASAPSASGNAAISGGGALATGARKGGRGPAAIAGGGTPAAAVRKEARQQAAATSGGAALAVGTGAHTASAAASGGGAALGAGAGAHAGPAATSGGGTALAVGSGAHAGPADTSGGGAALAVGSGAHAGSAATSGGGAPSAAGAPSAFQAAAISGGGAASAGIRKGGLGALAGASGAHAGSGALAGGGALAVEGDRPPGIGAIALADAAFGAASVADAARGAATVADTARGAVELSEVRVTP